LRCMCPFLPERCNEDGGEGEEGHSAKDLQGLDRPHDEGEGTPVKFKEG
jgi:hypothetical protein